MINRLPLHKPVWLRQFCCDGRHWTFFLGDGLVRLLGRVRIIVGGGLLAAAGIALSIITTHWGIALLGYALCGLGCANVSPVLISSLSKQTHMPRI